MKRDIQIFGLLLIILFASGAILNVVWFNQQLASNYYRESYIQSTLETSAIFFVLLLASCFIYKTESSRVLTWLLCATVPFALFNFMIVTSDRSIGDGALKVYAFALAGFNIIALRASIKIQKCKKDSLGLVCNHKHYWLSRGGLLALTALFIISSEMYWIRQISFAYLKHRYLI